MTDLVPLKAGPWHTFFFTVLSCGFFLALALVITALVSKRVKRLRTWIEFMFSIAFFCLSFLLLPIFGHDGSKQPPFALCLIQASLTYAAHPFAASSGACFILEVYYMTYISLRRQGHRDHSSTRLFVWIPPPVAITVFSLSIWTGIDHPGDVSVDDVAPYCHIVSPPPSQLVALCVIVSALSATIPSIYIMVLVYSNWRDYRRLTRIITDEGPSPFSLTVLLRIALFISMIAVVLSLDISSQFSSTTSQLWTIVLIMLPIGAILTFGTQRDILQAWASWLRISTKPSAT